jgi:hypothetical protein
MYHSLINIFWSSHIKTVSTKISRHVACNPCAGLLQAQRFPEGWNFQISRQSAHESRGVFNLPGNIHSNCSFLLEAGSTRGPECGRKDYANEKLQCHHRESNPRQAQCFNQLLARQPAIKFELNVCRKGCKKSVGKPQITYL